MTSRSCIDESAAVPQVSAGSGTGAEARLKAAVTSAGAKKYLYHAPDPLNALFHLMVMLESYPHRSCILRFTQGAERAGDIILCDGAVCLVVGTGSHVKLGEILGERYPDAAAIIATSIRQAKADRRPLGGMLLENGVPFAHVRECLRVQAIRGLQALSTTLRTQTLVAHELPVPSKSKSLLVFSPRELYAAVLHNMRLAEMTLISGLFDKYAHGAGAAVLFRDNTNDGWVPEYLLGESHLAFSDLVEMCGMVTRTVGPGVSVGPGDDPKVITVGTAERVCVLLMARGQCAMLIGVTPETVAHIREELHVHGPGRG